ncbi:MAG TPA: cytochrome c [Longimicrobiaceae bacterium]|nr:cytochrome c [Longimicrobiaceae bacterium]
MSSTRQITRRGLARALALGSLWLAGCSDWAGYDLDVLNGKVPWLSTMRESVHLDPWENPRLPAEGTIPARSPNGDVPPAFAQTQLDSAAATLTNPYTVTPAFVERGELQYERNCTVCHGAQGQGNGPVVGPNKFPFAPAVNAAPTQARSDGYLYGVIRVGRGLMPPYGDRLSQADAWAVVVYLRRLQGRFENPAPPPPVSGAPRAGPALVPQTIEPDASPATGTPTTTTDTAGGGRPR